MKDQHPMRKLLVFKLMVGLIFFEQVSDYFLGLTSMYTLINMIFERSSLLSLKLPMFSIKLLQLATQMSKLVFQI